MSILHEFYIGNVRPWERLRPEHPQYYELENTAIKLEEELIKSLNEDEQKLFNEIAAIRLETCIMETTQAFVDGFRLGTQFTIDSIKL